MPAPFAVHDTAGASSCLTPYFEHLANENDTRNKKRRKTNRNRKITINFESKNYGLFRTYKQGDSLLLDDGKLRMTVVDSGEGYVSCRVDVGGKLSNKKGVNTPTVRLPISAMTSKVSSAQQYYTAAQHCTVVQQWSLCGTG